MQQPGKLTERRTSADEVFDFLHEEISSLNLLPGAKISEAEYAAKFGVSRQPIRDAFSRLDNLDLIQIRPQKATVVKKFSMQAIETARFVRMSVELEVLRKATHAWNPVWQPKLEAEIEKQKTALKNAEVEKFHQLDYEFHQLLCTIANAEFAFEIIAANKAKVDRLCMLSLSNREGRDILIEDHIEMIGFLSNGQEQELTDCARKHLSRLDLTITNIHKEHTAFFE